MGPKGGAFNPIFMPKIRITLNTGPFMTGVFGAFEGFAFLFFVNFYGFFTFFLVFFDSKA